MKVFQAKNCLVLLFPLKRHSSAAMRTDHYIRRLLRMWEFSCSYRYVYVLHFGRARTPRTFLLGKGHAPYEEIVKGEGTMSFSLW